MNDQNKLIIKTFAGLEEPLAEELKLLGLQEISIHTRSVACVGSLKDVYRINYLSRLSLRVLIEISTFEVSDQHELYSAIKLIPWARYINASDTICIDVTSNQSVFNNDMFIAQKAKDGIADYFKSLYDVRPSVEKENPTLRINIHIYKNNCIVSLDSSGSSLHKRGYRKESTKAPINEVLAAGIINLTGWAGHSPFVDGMCGSGTFVTEAAMLAYKIPAGFYRESFGFLNWKTFKKDLWDEILIENKPNLDNKLPIEIIGIDSATDSVETSRTNLKFCNLLDKVTIKKDNFFDFYPPAGPAVLVLNPPYGERLDKDPDIIGLYKEIGDTLKNNYVGYKAFMISANLDAAKQLGLKPSRKIVLFNGSLEARLFKYEMYEGSRKVKKEEHES